jgi:hypothetical protein
LREFQQSPHFICFSLPLQLGEKKNQECGSKRDKRYDSTGL